VDAFGTRPFSATSGRYLSDGLLDFSNNNYSTTIANSAYHAFQASLEKRVGNVRLLGAYTYAKALDNASGFGDNINPFDHRVSRSLSSFDLKHNFVVSYSWDLPFQKWTPSSGAKRKILEGWRLTGITRFTTGLSITMGAGGDHSLCGCGGVDRPNYSGQPLKFSDPRASDTHDYFPTDPFSEEELGVPGNASRRFFHGPGLNNWDFSVQKTTKISEKVSTEFRAEFFNIFNHAQFTNPAGNFTSGNFGSVTGARDPRIGQFALKFIF
jgi:hypothetical protein